MSEKRFSFGDNVNLIIDEETGKSYGLYNFGSVIDFLNKLYDDKVYWEKCYKDLIKQVDTFRAGNEALHSRVRALMEENEQLKFQLKECREHKLYSRRKLEKENEQLKQFKEEVFAKIDMHLRMLPTARDNEFDEDGGDPSLYVGAIYMLETLKKELEE